MRNEDPYLDRIFKMSDDVSKLANSMSSMEANMKMISETIIKGFEESKITDEAILDEQELLCDRIYHIEQHKGTKALFWTFKTYKRAFLTIGGVIFGFMALSVYLSHTIGIKTIVQFFVEKYLPIWILQ